MKEWNKQESTRKIEKKNTKNTETCECMRGKESYRRKEWSNEKNTQAWEARQEKYKKNSKNRK